MVEVVSVERKSPVLAPSSLACLSHIPTINLTAGCAHGCLYCYTRGYRAYPGDNRVLVYANTLAMLREELRRKRKWPVAVYFSPSSDLFQPVPEVLDLAYEVLRFLLARRIGVAFLTKGEIPDRHMSLLHAHAPLVHAQIGLSTLKDEVLRVFEPKAARGQARLRQAQSLVAGGIATEVRLDPILPGFTDDAESLEALCEGIAESGVRRIAVSALFLRTAVLHSLQEHLGESERTRLLSLYCGKSIRLSIHAERSSVLSLPRDERQIIYERIRDIAQRYELQVAVCGCKNPDLASGSCNIAGDWPAEGELFGQEGIGLYEKAGGRHCAGSLDAQAE